MFSNKWHCCQFFLNFQSSFLFFINDSRLRKQWKGVLNVFKNSVDIFRIVHDRISIWCYHSVVILEKSHSNMKKKSSISRYVEDVQGFFSIDHFITSSRLIFILTTFKDFKFKCWARIVCEYFQLTLSLKYIRVILKEMSFFFQISGKCWETKRCKHWRFKT